PVISVNFAVDLLRCFGGFCLFVTTLKAFKTSGRIHELLFARKKRMALRANFDFDFLLCGPGYKRFTAGTNHTRFLIIRVNILFHDGSFGDVNYKLAPPNCKFLDDARRPPTWN